MSRWQFTTFVALIAAVAGFQWTWLVGWAFVAVCCPPLRLRRGWFDEPRT
jgi:hypothetical protein